MVNWSCLKRYHCLNIWRMPCCHAISFSQAIKRQLNAGHIQQAFYLGSLAEFHAGKETKRVVEIYRLIQYDPVITQTFLFCIMVHLCVRVFWLFVLPTSKDDKGGSENLSDHICVSYSDGTRGSSPK